MRFIVVIVLFAALIGLLMHRFPSAIANDMDASNLIYMALMLVVISGGLFSRREIPLRHHAKYALAWLGIIVVLMLGYSFWEDIKHSNFMGRLLPSNTQPQANGELVLHAAEDGHFYMEALVNGEQVRFLVDTGATGISLSRDDAKRIGIDVDALTYNIPHSTANGINFSAAVQFDTLEVAGITYKGINATVSRGGLSTSLLGMSLLKKFQSYSVENNQLILVP